jgi:hypothetical protein
MLRNFLLGLTCLAGLFVFHSDCSAQGLLWSLPEEEGTYVRYFGDFKQVLERPDSAKGPLEMTWQTELTIKALGKEEANYKGNTCSCRWMEFKRVTGRQSATGIDAGPYGVRIYKVLVPEAGIIGKVVDDRNIPVIMVPVIKGYQKVGNKPVQQVTEKVLTFYPLLGLFAYYPTLKAVGDADETVSLPQLGDVSARHLIGVETIQSMTSRSVNEGEIWTSDEIPFGWASYKAKVVREQKDRLAPAEAFKKHSEMQITMSAVEKGTGARSELNVADDGTVTVEEPAQQPTGKAEPSEENPFEEKPVAEEKTDDQKPATDEPEPSFDEKSDDGLSETKDQ